MAETIAPVVYGDRRRWRAALALHAGGATLAAAAFGGAVGWIGGLLGAPWGPAGALLVVGLAAAYGVRELLPWFRSRLPVPQARRQVPDWWRTFFSWPASAALYGAGLGVGFFTYLAHGTLVVVAVAAMASGRPILGAAVLAPFGLARGLSPVVARGVVTAEQGHRLVDRLAGSSAERRRVANAIAMGAVAATVSVVWWRARPPDPEAWSSLAAAALALTFGWAGGTKLAGGRRWNRTLERYPLPTRVRRIARSGVPIAEALVPALVVLGCFGGRDAVDVRAVLVRNATIGAAAAFVAIAGVDAPRLVWPATGPGDALPIALAGVGLVVAAGTGIAAAVWLRRGVRP
jgi:hypothetical protein